MDVEQVAAVDLAGRVAGQCQRQISSHHAVAIIGHPDQGLAAIGIGNIDPPRPGIQRVFDEFLDGGRGPLHHFARRNTVDRRLIQLADGGRVLRYIAGFGVHATSSSMVGGAEIQIRKSSHPTKGW